MSIRVVAACAALLLAACKPSGETAPASVADAPAVAPILTSPDAVDVHSFAKPLDARVTHVALDLGVDFDAKRLAGTATLDVQARPGVGSIVLDDKGLEILKVMDSSGKPLPYTVGKADPDLGAPLTIAMGPARKIVINYRSAPDAGALQWLDPAQTAGKKYPYLFSQGESIENRSWIPTQDSPGIRQSWEATIHVPAPLTAVMSAPSSGLPASEGEQRSFSFAMEHPVAPYLIALSVGDLAFRPLGPRTGVWTEPALLDAAASELEDSEKMVSAAEAIYGPYRWGRYDMLVLPPSFPFGGMENPNLTFLTPTFIAGDKSLVSLIAHELAHSWSGNLATHATWGDIWLNEGMTTYAERRIVESLYGPKVAAQQVALGIDALDKAIEEAGGPTSPDTKLHRDLKGKHPDDGLSDIAYEKGAAFLRMIEATVGRPRFDTYLKGYFDRHAFQPVTSAIFLADIRANLLKGDPALEKALKLDQCVYQPGVPDNAVPADPKAFEAIDAASAAFAKGAAPDKAAWASWNTDERLRFLNRLPRKQDEARLDALDQAFALDSTRNNEVLFAWLDLATRNRYDPAVPALTRFMSSVGRGKFVRPLYKTLSVDAAWGRPLARRIYAVARPGYHPLVTREVDKTMAGK